MRSHRLLPTYPVGALQCVRLRGLVKLLAKEAGLTAEDLA